MKRSWPICRYYLNIKKLVEKDQTQKFQSGYIADSAAHHLLVWLYNVMDLINGLLGNSSVNTAQHATIE
jgi:hypothetical protein